MKKTLKNVYVCDEHFIENCYEISYRFEMLGAKIRKEKTEKDAVPKINTLKFLAPLGLNHRKFLYAVIQEIPSCHRQDIK